MTLPLTSSILEHLLQRRNADPSDVAIIDGQIESNFTHCYAVLILDMSGFSRLTIECGIIHFLGMIQRLVDIVTPIVEAQHGTVFKQEADNVFAVFPTVEQAVTAAFEVLDGLAIANQTLPSNQALYASMGIGYGDLIVVSEPSNQDNQYRIADVFGCEMNLASKLGEDLAEPGEILLTDAAHAQLTTPTYTSHSRTVTISKVELVVHTITLAQEEHAQPSAKVSVA